MKGNLQSSFRLLLVTVSAALAMWCGTAGLLSMIDAPSTRLNGGSTHVLDWSSLTYASASATFLTVLLWIAAYSLGLRRPLFGFAVFAVSFLLLEAVIWYLGSDGSRVFGLTPEIADLFEDDGVMVLLMVIVPLVALVSGVIYAGSVWLLRRCQLRPGGAQF
jgi:hypothetical protein